MIKTKPAEDMMEKNDIRWKQRFQNFERAYGLLNQAVESKPLNHYSDLEKEGIVQRFEYTFELGWKTWKDYLEHEGIILDEITPRKVIKACVSNGIFTSAEIDADIYLAMMLERNALSHVYDAQRFAEALNRIGEKYIHVLKRQYDFLLYRKDDDCE
jgi:nucleotidyltransferase substrate binding protein (TIGR01987 family)